MENIVGIGRDAIRLKYSRVIRNMTRHTKVIQMDYY